MEDIGKKAKQHAEECSRHLSHLDKVLVARGLHASISRIIS